MDNNLNVDNTMLLQARSYVKRLVEGFSADVLPSHGVWAAHSMNQKMILADGKVVATFKTEIDAGYVRAVQPDNLKLLLIYVAYLEEQLKKVNDANLS